MTESEQPHIDYYFRKERLGDDGGERVHARLVGDLTAAKAGGLVCDFRVIERGDAFPTQADESAMLKRLREFSMVKKIGLGRQFGSNKYHFSWFPSHALLVSVGSELRNVFPCELENGYVEPEAFLESLLKREPWAVGGVERRKRLKRHDRIADRVAANPDLLELGLTFRGAEVAVSSTSGEGGSIDLLFLDSAGLFLIVEVKSNKRSWTRRAAKKAQEAVCRDVSYRGFTRAARRGLSRYSVGEDRRICRNRNYVFSASMETARHGLESV